MNKLFVSVSRNLLMNNLSFHQEAIKQIQIHNTAYHVTQELTLLRNQHLVQIVLLDRSHPINQYHAQRAPQEKHPAVINPFVNHVIQGSSPAQEHLVSTVLLVRSLQILEQHHALPVLPGSTANLIEPVARLVLLEHFPQMLDQKIASNAHKVLIHHLDQQIAPSVLKEAMPAVREILRVLRAKPESTLVVLDPHLALTVMRVAHPLKDLHSAHCVVKVPLLLILDQVVVQHVQLVNLVIVPDKPIVLIAPLVLLQVQVPLLALNVLLVLMHLVQHHQHVVSALLEHILPILEQLVVILVMQDTILMLVRMIVQLAHKVIILQVQGLLHVPNVLQAITPLVLDPHNVKFVLLALTPLLDLVAALNAQQEPTQNNLEVVNALIVQLENIHQELDQQAVKPALWEHMLLQDQLNVVHVKEEVLPVRKVVVSVSLVLLEHIL